MIYRSTSAAETEALGEKIGRSLKQKILLLKGDLGSGKTTFTRGLARALGISGSIPSPTFTYSRVHRGQGTLYHFDCYRLKTSDALIEQEILEAEQDKNGVVAIEWPERISAEHFGKAATIQFRSIDEHTREIEVQEL